ncbi:sodium:proline symporter [Thiosulfativibrio zosterae]|uniref:Sodium/proline symporter n=2 Tax=Thiosulfativibrio zosterae TaxID=2675053 RepID=A0A6F8PNV5_9GAMM|nr:sodium:proline symporter [Thiosulfativibrio zosterae]
MFIGMIGMTYTSGLSAIWLALGWILGDFIANFIAVKKIQIIGHQKNIQSYGELLASWQGKNFKKIRVLAGFLTLIFLVVYAAAQLKAGSKATETMLDWSASSGIVISAMIILAYSFVGGLRASIWTDVAQSIVMISGMLLLLWVGTHHFGGITNTLAKLQLVSETYMNWFSGTYFEWLLFFSGWVFGGLGVLGQPHIVIRFMTLDKVENVNKMRLYYYFWFLIAFLATIGVGLLTRLAIPESAGFDAELALPTMANQLLPEFLVGMVLAAMFAATMSTADSLILACSAAITKDLLPHKKFNLITTKLITLSILVCATLMALSNNDTVFTLVLYAWGILSSAFVPLILIYAFNKPITEKLALMMIISGPIGYLFWKHSDNSALIYAVALGVMSGLLVYFIGQFQIKRIKHD